MELRFFLRMAFVWGITLGGGSCAAAVEGASTAATSVSSSTTPENWLKTSAADITRLREVLSAEGDVAELAGEVRKKINAMMETFEGLIQKENAEMEKLSPEQQKEFFPKAKKRAIDHFKKLEQLTKNQQSAQQELGNWVEGYMKMAADFYDEVRKVSGEQGADEGYAASAQQFVKDFRSCDFEQQKQVLQETKILDRGIHLLVEDRALTDSMKTVLKYIFFGDAKIFEEQLAASEKKQQQL